MNLKEQHECRSVLMLDKIQLLAGLPYNHITRGVSGSPTLPLADSTHSDDAMANHGLVFTLDDVTTRKQAIAYHSTGDSFRSDAVKCVILEMTTP